MKRFDKKSIRCLALCIPVMLSFFGCSTNKKPTEKPVVVVDPNQGYVEENKVGKLSDYVVMTPKNATEAEKFASQEFVSYAKKITGRELAVIDDGSDLSKEKVVSIGRTQAFQGNGLKADETELNGDGFIVKTIGDDLFICGGNDRGTLYGVYDVLEYMCGVKFIMDDCTYIPKAENLELFEADRTEIPAFQYRVFLDPLVFADNEKEYFAHRRFTTEYITMDESFGGNIKWFKDYQYEKTHNALEYVNFNLIAEGDTVKPEYLHCVANNGSTVEYSPESRDGFQKYAADLCYTDGINDDGTYEEYVEVNGVQTKTAVALAIEGMKEKIKNDTTESNYYMFGQQDIFSRPCLCDKCKTASEKYTDTGIMIRFVNALTKAVTDWKEAEGIDREIKIVMFAYQYSKLAPVKEVKGKYVPIDSTCKLNDNIIVRLAPLSMDRTYACSDEIQDKTDYTSNYLKKWKAVGNHFMMWTYHCDFGYYYGYLPTLQTMRQNFNEYKDMGVMYVFLQSNYQEPTVYQTKLDSYVASKLLWNPEHSVEDLIKEFNYYYFGKDACSYVDEYVELMNGAFAQAKINNPGYTVADGKTEADTVYLYPKGFTKRLLELFDDGVTAVENSALSQNDKNVYIRRLKEAKLMPRYIYLFNSATYGIGDVERNELAEEFIRDVLSFGGKYYGEGVGRMFDLESLKYRN